MHIFTTLEIDKDVCIGSIHKIGGCVWEKGGGGGCKAKSDRPPWMVALGVPVAFMTAGCVYSYFVSHVLKTNFTVVGFVSF